ncbi:sialate O-acetylesterase [Emticicia agri]|uniref:T9SS type A sorting domain-containing protein n=1 Tax=Emticicia agri TaxID=2492393 RepID=A0A4Q5M068_9BACT|nr:sialate O-acetylesterase [Emticicia agri]RYU95548.1 T9SS type A sorting domain-containing protein [Emticicia agri]
MRILSLIAILLIITSTCFSQIQISFPKDRSVFQRNNQNTSVVNISGNFDGELDKVEARLVPVKANQGVLTNWVTIATKPEGGYFVGTLQGQGGWYTLQVRGWLNESIVAQGLVSRVGIGEVFVVAGQSNAEGVLDYGAKPSLDDRVNCFNYRVQDNLWDYPYFSSFSHIETNTMVGPKGQGSWCWGELGDYLAQRLNVPILFLNAAYGGSSSENWYSSALGKPTKNAFHLPYIGGAPYSSLRISLQFYASYLGIRAVLWEQGEDDSETTEDNYYNNIKTVIERSRIDANKNLSWVISRTSLNDFAAVHVNHGVIRAQNRIISNIANVYEGPYTDSIQIPRVEGVHFKNLGGNNDGISALAKAWNTKLNDSFFDKSIPFLSSSLITLQASCQFSETAKLSLPSNFESQRWSDNSTGASLTADNGSFSVVARDNHGNYYFSNTVNVKGLAPSIVPFATTKRNPNFCEGSNTELITNDTHYSRFRWNTGETNKSITINTSGIFTVRGINSLDCFSPPSNEVITRVLALPPKPNIIMSSGPTACEGATITLYASGFGKSFWSTNDSTGSLMFTKPGDYSVSVKVRDENGCVSVNSDVAKISIKPRPEQPTIAQIGAFSLEAEQMTEKIDAYEWRKDDAFLTTRASIIKSAKPGFFTATAVKNYQLATNQILGCRSIPSKAFSFIPNTEIKNLVVYPNPVTDGVVYLEAREDLSDLIFTVYNTSGKFVYSTLVPSLTERREINLSFLQDGKYIIRLQNSKFSESKSIWIER